MKHFLRDQLPFILFFYSQLALVILTALLTLAGFDVSMSASMIVYMFLLPTCFLLIFLGFRYHKFRDFYTGLTSFDTDQLDHSWFPDPPNYLLEHVKEQHEQQYISYRQQVEALEADKQQGFDFIQQWVHQMKTPVSVMDLTLQKEKLQLPEEFLQSMQEEIERLRQGLDVALYQSRLQKFDRDFHVEKLALRTLVKDAIQEFKSSFIRNQVFPELSIDETLIVATDQKWLRFVLDQLISNAIKYSHDTSEKVYFTAEVIGEKLALHVRDHGHGIPSQDLKRVFDPFFTGMNGRTFRESTGMGLYLSKEICEALGHTITIASEKDVGTTVTITFENTVGNLEAPS
ncbi:sensor histidine kinase [Lentibacillus sp. Marseille-P4043]|uniref:sensor histidine kinase n=1 Tax=Lentibacillus sp. Marseille-P4043 TaxID=2040293 RepID=UPI000D0ACC7A|nr:sensor histidine kinase [Lentibacillus sp. Marseille-P4043]